MDLFVLPSLREGISNTILEAMATGLPVVATRVGGNPELVDEGNTGMLVPNSDAVSMAMAIGSYLENAEKSSAHGKAGRARVESQFTMNSMVAGYLADLRFVARSKISDESIRSSSDSRRTAPKRTDATYRRKCQTSGPQLCDTRLNV